MSIIMMARTLLNPPFVVFACWLGFVFVTFAGIFAM
jgi:hypothetical protein